MAELRLLSKSVELMVAKLGVKTPLWRFNLLSESRRLVPCVGGAKASTQPCLDRVRLRKMHNFEM